MAKTLGTLTVLIGASTALFQRELEEAGDSAEKWAKGTSSTIGRAIAKIDDDLAKFSKSANQTFSSPIGTIQNFIGQMKIIGPVIQAATVSIGAFAASFGLIGGVVTSQVFLKLSESIQTTADTADRLGVSFEFLQGLEQAAASFGINAGQVNDNLRQMTTNLGSAQLALEAGSTSASGFAGRVESMGLSVQKLFAQDPEERFLTLVDAIAALPNETERAVAAVQIFGESGRDLVSISESGSESLTELIERFSELGASLSGGELQRIENARAALSELDLVIEGLVQRFLASFAPIITTLAEFLTQSQITGEGVKGAMDAMALGVARAIGVIDDIVAAGFGTWFKFRGVVQLVVAGMVDLMGAFLRAVETTASAIGNVLLSTANGIANFVSTVINGTLDRINDVISAANNIPGVNIPGINARVNVPSFGGGFNVNLGSNVAGSLAQGLRANAQDLIDIGGTFEGDFLDRFLANRDVLPVPRPPSQASGILPPPPSSGGGGGSGGGRGASSNLREQERAARELAQAIERARQQLERLSETFSSSLQDTRDSNEAEQFRLELLKEGAMRIDEQVSRFESLQDARNKFADAEMQIEELLNQGLITQEQYAESIGRITNEFEALEMAFAQSDALAQAQDRVRATAELTDELNQRLQETLGINERLTEVERIRLEIRRLDVELTSEQITSLEKLASVVDLTAEKTKRLEAQYELLEQTSNILIDAGSNLFQSLIRGTGSLEDRIGNFFNSLFDQLLQLSINTIFQTLLGGGGGGGFLGNIFGGLLGFQSGGVVPETGPYILHSGERVFNRAEVGRMRASQGGVVINNYSSANVSTRDSANGEREIIIRDAVKQARTAVANDFTRSVSSGYGTYSNGIQGSYILRRKI